MPGTQSLLTDDEIKKQIDAFFEPLQFPRPTKEERKNRFIDYLFNKNEAAKAL